MKKLLISTLITSVVFFTGTGTASAQDDGFVVIPAELYACSYNERRGADDLDKVIAKWNAWADRNAIDSYAAWTLVPYYFGEEQDFDVLWLGAGKDAVALGRAQDLYLANNGGLDEEFEEVVTCNAHNNFASLNYKAPPEGMTPRNSVLTFSDCKFRDGATFQALGAAMAEWSKYLSDQGSTAAIFHWYPVYGGGGEEFDFKWLEVFTNLEDLGSDYERYGNGGGFMTYNRLLAHLIECDSSRAYLAQNRRYVQLR